MVVCDQVCPHFITISLPRIRVERDLLLDLHLQPLEHRLLVGVFQYLRDDLLGRLVAPTGAVLEVVAGRMADDERILSGLCYGVVRKFPSWKHQYARMTLKCPRQDLSTFHSQTYPVVLDR